MNSYSLCLLIILAAIEGILKEYYFNLAKPCERGYYVNETKMCDICPMGFYCADGEVFLFRNYKYLE